MPRSKQRQEAEADRELRFLLLEDAVADAKLCERELKRTGLRFTLRVVETLTEFETELDRFVPDLILSDFTFPGGFDGMAALETALRKLPDVPFIFISGTIGEERAVEAIRGGAADYLLKDRMARLGPAVARALERSRLLKEKEQAEAALRASDFLYQSIFDNIAEGILLCTLDGGLLAANPAAARILGYGSADELVSSVTNPNLWLHAESGDWRDLIRRAQQGGEVHGFETRAFRKDGEKLWTSLSARLLPDERGGTPRLLTVIADITERKLQQQRIERLLRIRAFSSGINAAIARVRERGALLKEICRIASEQGQFEMVWIGTIDHEKRDVRPVAWSGFSAETANAVSWATISTTKGTLGEAVHSRKPAVRDDIDSRLPAGKLRQEAVEKGCQSTVCLPLVVDGDVVALIALFAAGRGFFDQDELTILDEIAPNISFALESIARQEKIERLSRIRSVLGEINAAIVRTRDRQELFDEACRIAVEAGRFPFAWIGLVKRDTMEIKPLAQAGVESWPDAGMHRAIRPLDGKSPQGRGPSAEAAMEKKPVIVNDVQNDPRISRKQDHLERNINSIAVLPLLVAGEAVGVLGLHAREAGFFDEEEVKLLSELAGDIAFALQTIDKQDQIDYLSYYDPLTGLPNRTLFIDRAGQQMRARGGEPRMVALILLNIERFRYINESFGRHGGDALLKLVAQRLEAAFHGKDYLARIGADSFGVVIRGIRDAEAAVHAVEVQLLGCFGEPYRLNGDELRVSAQVGIAMFPADGGDADTLFKNAEAALKKSRDSGERYLFYAADMNARAAHILSLETRLRKAIEAQEFVLHYQPKIELANDRICGLEALIRWQEPGAGLVAPGTFIPLLEETGLILEVGKWALARALVDYREWTARGCKVPRIAVNVSAIQLQQKDFSDLVINVVQEQGGGSDALEIEVTESLLMKDVEGSIRKLSLLRGLGIHIAMDDFGTGYSSLSYIARLPITSVKIDRSFINVMANSPQDMAIVTTIIALAHSLKLRVVAEGVETESQSKLLKLLKCDEAQGFLFSKPLPAAEIEPLLRTLA